MNNNLKRERFIAKSIASHPGEKLDYSEVVYVNSKTPVKIIDHDVRPDGSEYGVFWQTPENHVRGQGHPEKRSKKISKTKSSKQEEIIARFKEAHLGENLDYSQVKYVNMHTKVKIISHDLRPDGTEYGEFWQEPSVHLKGCTHMGIKKIGRPRTLPITFSSENFKEDFLDNIKKINDGATAKNVSFVFVPMAPNTSNSLLDYVAKCKREGISLISIFEDEYTERKDVVINKIKHILGLNGGLKRIFGRKCTICEITKEETKKFLNQYHIQGYGGFTVSLGAFYNKELISVMTFVKKDIWELNRFCTKIDYICPGVASKMFAFFIKKYNPESVKSFLDRRWCFSETDNLYTKLGFEEKDILPPDYRYIIGDGKRHHKFNFRKQVLHKKYGFPLTMTESEMTEALGYYKIWDCGLIRYKWKKPLK